MATRASYIKVYREGWREYQVIVEYDDGTAELEKTHKFSDEAERHAERLSKRLNCDWGQNY